MQPYCSTGNCTWPLFTSLGFCSKCEDISKSLQDSMTYVEVYKKPHQTVHEDLISYEVGFTYRNYTYMFPELNGQFLSTDKSYPFFKDSSFTTSFYPYSSSRDPSFFAIPLYSLPGLSFNFTDGTSTLGGALISFIRLSAREATLGDVLAADVCALSFCAQKRNVSVFLDRLSSTILQTVHGNRIAYKSDFKNQTYYDALSFIGDDFDIVASPFVPTRLAYSNDSIPGFPGYDNLDPLNLWELNLHSLILNFQDKMTQELDFSDIASASYQQQNAFSIMTAFNASSNISMTMENIAIALTNYVRAFSNLTVVGQAGQVQVYVNVTWAWIILPTSLVIAGIIFLILAMYETKRQGACVWRTSEMTLLFHGRKIFDEELHARHQVSDMEHAASEIRVKMTKTSNGGWTLLREKED